MFNSSTPLQVRALPPEDIPRLNSMIESGVSIGDLIKSTRDRRATFAHYMEYMGAKYEAPKGLCTCCRRTENTVDKTCHWDAMVDTKETIGKAFLFTAILISLGMIVSVTEHFSFVTQHTFCKSCLRGIIAKRMFGELLRNLLFIVLLLSLLAAVFSVFFMVMAFALEPTFRLKAIGAVLGSFLLLCLVIWAYWALRKLNVPAPLRDIGRFPFSLLKIK